MAGKGGGRAACTPALLCETTTTTTTTATEVTTAATASSGPARVQLPERARGIVLSLQLHELGHQLPGVLLGDNIMGRKRCGLAEIAHPQSTTKQHTGPCWT